jgi:hypothetical protein
MTMPPELFAAIYSQYENHSPFAVLIRVVLQVILPAQKMDELFNKTADKQYERNLLFSTLMVLMLEVVMRTSPSIHHSYRQHQDSIPVSFQSIYNKLNQLAEHLKSLSKKIDINKFKKK